MNPSPGNSDDEKIADARSLFGDDETAEKNRSHPSRRQGAPLGEGYEIEGGVPDDEPAPPPRAPIAPKRPAVSRDRAEGKVVEEQPIEESSVDDVWSRWGEWGPTLLRLALIAAITMVLTYFAFGIGIGTAFLVLMLGGAAFVLMSYPIAVTLERPVRMTPEQAVKDYFSAASHHFPQYRRMWLFLSTKGRSSPEFFSFAEFQSYWQRRLGELRGGHVKSTTPLVFEISDFRSEKSAGKTALGGKYTVTVRSRGESTEPLATVRISSSFVRGPDSMWYLNSGTLPKDEDGDRSTKSRSR
ncbi:MAG: hypothetical protein JWN86_4573 [Planctomycetota bacterium]|nr:hypothetical protein [Planctomycetota bacterium]